MPQHIIIIPTYNEKENIIPLLQMIFATIPEVHVLIVDDNSPDGTANAVENLIAQYPNRLKLLRRAGKNGLGRAYVDGFKKILTTGNEFSTITMMDGDLSHNPKHLPEMMRLAGQYDFVVGSRYIPNGGITDTWGWHRRLLSWGGNFYLRFLFRYPLYDWTTGYNTIRIDMLRKINFNLLNPHGYAFISSLKYHLLEAGATFQETPIFFEERIHGVSKMSFAIILEGVFAPWRILLRKYVADLKDFKK